MKNKSINAKLFPYMSNNFMLIILLCNFNYLISFVDKVKSVTLPVLQLTKFS